MELEKTIEKLNEGIKGIQDKVAKKDSDFEALEQKHTELSAKLDELGEVGADVRKQQEQLDQISTDLKKFGERTDMKASAYEMLEKSLKGDDFRAKLKNAKNHSTRGQIADMEIKAASGDITTADINSGSIRTEYESGVAKHPWMENPLYALIPKGTIGQGRDSVSWWEEEDRADNAEWVAENAAPSAQSSLEWTKQSMDIKLVKDHIKMSVSALEDFEYTRSEILDMLQNNIPRKIEQELFDGDNTTLKLYGITQQAKPFAKPDNFDLVTAPNYIDATRAVATQIMNGNNPSDSNKKGYMPNVLFLNAGTLQNMRGMKDDNNGYIIPPLGQGVTSIDGIRIIPTLDLAADEFLMGDFSKCKLYMKRMMNISFHYENEDDALKDLVMVMASVRAAGVKIATPHKFAFVTGTFTAVKNEITAI